MLGYSLFEQGRLMFIVRNLTVSRNLFVDIVPQ